VKGNFHARFLRGRGRINHLRLPGAASHRMMITYVGLISRAKMENFNFRFGGITWPALEEFIQPDSLQVGDMIRRLPKARGLDSDSRYNRVALVAMSLALSIAAKEDSWPRRLRSSGPYLFIGH